jgi:carboxylesterase
MAGHTEFQNPQLEGDSFLWEGGPVGVLLSHGFTATTAEVRLFARFLHERGYTVAGPLLPGHGTTPEEMNRHRWQDWATAVESAYQELASRCERVFVGGESMGAILALYLAAEHPEALGILAYAPALKVASRATPLLLPLLAPFVPVVSKGESPRTHADDFWQGYTVNPLRAAAELARLQREVRRRLTEITQPLLIVQGRLDRRIAPDAPALLAREVRSTWYEIHWLEQSTHCVLLDREWQQAADLGLNFITRVLGDWDEGHI